MKKLVCWFGVLLLAMSALAGCGSGEETGGSKGLQPVMMDLGSPDEMAAGTDTFSAVDAAAGKGTVDVSDDGQTMDFGKATGKTDSMVMYKEVLRGEREFLDSEGGGNLKLDQVRQAVTPDAGVSIEPDEFAVVDLDRDGEPEVVISLRLNGDTTYGSLVLHCRDGIVHGYVFSQRAFGEVKADGTFLASGGAADVGICKIIFDRADIRVDEITYCESSFDAQNALTISYFVDRKAAVKEEYDIAYGEWERLPDVKWQRLTEDNIDGMRLPGEGAETAGSQDLSGTLKGQIANQSFAVSLDGWGDVTFAAFEPEAMSVDAEGQPFGDVCFKLIKDGEAVYTFPGYNEENVWYSQQFGQVVAVAFRDYDGDGREDIFIIIEYAGVQGPSIDVPFRSARVYTQEDGETVFKLEASLSEYLCHYTDSMSRMYEGLESYAANYSVATSKKTWEVEGFAREVKQYILGGDFEGLSEVTSFPITVDGVTYQDSEAFLAADFVGNPNPDFLEKLKEESCENMFVNFQGIMMGNGIIWFAEVLDASNLSSKSLKVTGINGLTSQ